jgi:hypothetical protein
MILVFLCVLVSLFQLSHADVVFPMLTLECCHSFDSTRQVCCSLRVVSSEVPRCRLVAFCRRPTVTVHRRCCNGAQQFCRCELVMHQRPWNSCGRLEHSAVELVWRITDLISCMWSPVDSMYVVVHCLCVCERWSRLRTTSWIACDYALFLLTVCVHCLRTMHVFAVCTRVWLQWSRLSRLRTRRLQ